jgi:predicted dehydrogenase
VSVNVALVGLGYWGPNLARNLVGVDGARLHTICDARSERLTELARQYPDARCATDYASVLADDAVDAVVLATPVHTHFALAKAALGAGKSVLVEKPLAETSEECLELIRIADESSLTLMVGHVFIFNAAVQMVKSYIDSGEIGEVLYIYSQRLNLGQIRQDVNALWNFGPHDLSILCHWLDSEPVKVRARGYSYIQPGIEDVVFMTLDFPGGVGVNVHISWLDPLKVRQMTVVGSTKMIVYDDVRTDARITVYDRGVTRAAATLDARSSLGAFDTFGEFQLLLRAGDVLIPKLPFVEPLKLECEHFVDCVRSGRPPLTGGETGLQVVRVLEAAQRSLLLGGSAEELSTV